MAYWQARSALWYGDSLYLYAFAFIVINAGALRASALNSLLFAGFTLATQFPYLYQTGVSHPLLHSAAAVTLVFVYISRSTFGDEIKYYLSNQQNAEAQKNAIEMTIEFNDRIRALLPREVSRRLDYFLSVRGWTVLQAMDEVLQPQTKEITCIFSDIRGYTKGTKNTDGFIADGVLPNVRACTSSIEDNNGIPRKIGDLIFAYFDDDNKYTNLIRCLRAGSALIRTNQEFNQATSNAIEIERHVLIASGAAVVGNLGGLDSSVEITALGSPVNYLARVDELTKSPELASVISEPALVLCEQTKSLLDQLELPIETTCFALAKNNLQIRDFDESTNLWIMPICDETDYVLDQALSRIDQENHGIERKFN